MREHYSTYKVKGNTLVEVLIALAILSFCGTLSVIIFLNIQKGSLPFFKLKAVELCERYMKETIDKKIYVDDILKDEEFSVKRSITTHELFPDCYLIRIIVFDGSKKKLFEFESVNLKD